MNKQCNVLILGGGGFIGLNLAQWLQKTGYHVTVFDRMMPSNRIEGATYIDGDFFNDETLEKIVEGQDVIIHSLSTINPSNSNQAKLRGYTCDFVHTVKLFDLAARKQIRVIYLSSAGTVYGRYDGKPFDERHALQPINHYGSLKVCIETAMRAYNEQQAARFLSCRITNPYGPGQDFNKGVGFIDAVLKHALDQTPTEIWGDGNVMRDYIYIDDVCRMLERLIHYEGPYHVFNLGTGEGVTQNEIIEVVSDLGLPSKVEYLPARAVDTKINLVNCERISEILPEPCLSVREGISQYMKKLGIATRGEKNDKE